MDSFINPDLLADNADKIHKEQITRYFTDAELTAFKNELADCHVQLQQRNNLVSKVKKLLKLDLPDPVDNVMNLISESKIEGEDGTKTLSARIDNLSAAINTRSQEVNEDVYTIFYPEENKAGVYNILGHLIYDRPLLPGERQMNLFKNIKTGTDHE